MSKQTQAPKAFIAMEKAALAKEINAIGRDGNRLNHRIQLAALNAIHYSIAEGYVQYASNLVTALTNTARKQALVTFLEKHGKVQWSKAQKEFIFRKRDDVTIDSVGAIEDQWYDEKKPPELRSSLDIEESFEKWLKRMEAEALKMNAAHKAVKHMEWLKAVAEFHAQWHREQIEADLHEQPEEAQPDVKAALEGKPQRHREIRKAA